MVGSSGHGRGVVLGIMETTVTLMDSRTDVGVMLKG